MTVLVTGGAGFIGAAVVRQLLAGGHRVRVLDNLETGSPDNLSDQATFVRGDLRDREVVAKAAAGCDGVVHLAAMVSVSRSFAEPELCFEVNVEGTRHVLEAARRAGSRRVVLASSAAVYGNEPSLPKREDMAAQPASPYAHAKWQNEVDALYYRRYLGLETVSLRFFNVFGPRQRPDSPYAGVISVAASKLLAGEPFTVFGDGEQTRDFVFVDDVASAVMGALTHPDAPPDVLNVGRARGTSLLALLRMLGDAVGREPELRFSAPRAGDVRHSVAETSRLAALIASPAATPLSEGLERLLDWMKPPR